MIIKNYIGGRAGLMRGDVNLIGSNIVAALVAEGSSFMDDNPANMAAFTNLKEYTGGAGYIRVALTGYTLTSDIVRDKVIYKASNPIWVALGNDPAGAIAGVILLAMIGADAVCPPLYGYKLNVPVLPGGTDYEFPFSADGISEL